ncbi:MAG: VCBS repeat-containing protein [Deltaproteobacteria bacterium]|nr:VCBS repeat-containing protein [Deltaproteobacteria bacterium]
MMPGAIPRGFLARSVAFALTLGLLAPALGGARAEGVSPSRLSLPSGPGSLEGIGENASPNINMGLVSYGVPIEVPQGHAGLTPSLSLSYSSSGGSSLVGMGWSFGVPSIERMTSEGLPRYGPDDMMAADGGSELVRLPGTDTYRARFEGGFVRYRWIDPRGDGRDGHWTAEYPDGRVGWFGARSNGNPDLAARVAGPDGTFRWYLSEMVDTLGHRIRYEYVKEGADSLPTRIAYAFDQAGVPHYQIVLGYEQRSDHLVDAKPGFELRQTKRLTGIQLLVGGVQRRRHQLVYELPEQSGGLSRLAAVYHYGVGDAGPHAIAFRFDYSDRWYPGCDDGACRRPYVKAMTSVGGDFATGALDLVDMNGDGLPDVLDTTDGVHRVHLNELLANGTHRFRAPYTSAVATGGSATLASPMVQMFDLDGDGFMDLVDGANSLVYTNEGQGDWDGTSFLDIGLPDFALDADLRFFDWDNDKAVDVMHADRSATWVFVNRGDGTYDTTETFTEDALELGFTQDGIQLADMNGDGLQDVVRVLDLVVAYRPNLGWGRFGGWVEVGGIPPVLASELQLVDVNGDGLSDALVILGNEVRYALNRRGLAFDPVVVIDDGDVAGGIPERTSEVSVRLADMNGNGSTDVVWITASGLVTYLELEPIRPNLLTRVRNGVGKVIELKYGTSVSHMVRDGGPAAWLRRLPQPHQVLDELTHFDALSGLRQTQTFRYHDGYWDGEEKQFRGFENVEVVTTGDSTIETGLSVHHFDVGVEDRYRHGLLVRQDTFSAGRLLEYAEDSYADCPVAGVPADLEPAVRHVCKTVTTRTLREGQPASKAVTTREETTYDGYGNATRTAKLGVVAVGGGACTPCDRDPDVFGAPCGDQCLGDEIYTDTTYIPPGAATANRWTPQLPYHIKSYGRPGAALAREERIYYDGAPFEGMPLGTADRGFVTRKATLAEPGVWVSREQNRRDAHGNLVEERDGNGHGRRVEYDPEGLHVVAEEVLFDDPSRAAPYAIRMETTIDPVLERIVRAGTWHIPGDPKAGLPKDRLYTYDAFGRLVTKTSPLDPSGAPETVFSYDLGDPVSRIVSRQRSRVGGPLDLESIQCLDGHGRGFQSRTRLDDGRYEVRSYQLFNSQGQAHRELAPFDADDARCDQIEPPDLYQTNFLRDANGRVLEKLQDDAALFGTASVERRIYGPLWTARLDPGATDPSDARAGVRRVTYTDGLGRPVRYTEEKADGQFLWSVELVYDGLGNLHGTVDLEGHETWWHYDRLGRLVRHDDPTSGTTTFEYDHADNLVAQTRADGVTMRFAYDEADRLVAQWDEDAAEATRIEHFYDRPVDCAPGVCTNTIGQRSAVRYPVEIVAGEPTIASEVMGYDAASRPVYNALVIDGRRWETRFELDLAGRMRRLVLPGGSTIDYEFDARSRLVAIPGYVPAVRYDVSGIISEIELANGVRTQFTHDILNTLAAQRTIAPDGTLLQDFEVTRDRIGNLRAVLDRVAREGAPSGNATFSYDLRSRLVEAMYDGDRPTLAETLSYGYDAVDNLVTKTSTRPDSPEHVGALEYGGASAGPYAVTRAGDVTYDYNAAGLMTRHGQDAYAWDFMGRLVSAERGDRELARFVYGEGEERLAKIEGGQLSLYLGSDVEIRDGVVTAWLTVGDQRVAKIERASAAAEIIGDLAPVVKEGTRVTVIADGVINAGDALIAARALSGDLAVEVADPAPVDRILMASNRRTLVGDSERVTYLHTDALGSTALTTDESGRPVLWTQYYPYGETRYTSRGWLEDYSFSGKERDTSTGLTYFGARYLDPRIGRWVSPDLAFASPEAGELDSAEAINRYVYALNSPVSFKDERGRASMNNFNRNGNSAGFTSASVAANYNHMHGFAWKVRPRERGTFAKRPMVALKLSLPSWQSRPKPETKTASTFTRTKGWNGNIGVNAGPNPRISEAIKENVNAGAGMTLRFAGTTHNNLDDTKGGTGKVDQARTTLVELARAEQMGANQLEQAASKMAPGAKFPENTWIEIDAGGTNGVPGANIEVHAGPTGQAMYRINVSGRSIAEVATELRASGNAKMGAAKTTERTEGASEAVLKDVVGAQK